MIENFQQAVAVGPFHEVLNFFKSDNAFAMVILFISVVLAAYFLSRYVAKAIIRIAQKVATRSDAATDEQHMVRLRQIETYLSITVAAIRAIIVAVVAYITWRIISPSDTPTGVAAIGASAFFIVFAGQTLGMILRDVTAGAMMITEKWFSVGDFVRLEPFINLSGVVEQFNLRSVKLRSITGEVVWVNNQTIHGAHVTPRGVKTLAVDVFTHDKETAQKVLEKTIKTIPTGTMLLLKPLKITRIEQWNDDMTRFTVVGQTAPGREWLIDKFLVEAIESVDDDKKKEDRLFIYKPIARFADEAAARKFRRAVRTSKE